MANTLSLTNAGLILWTVTATAAINTGDAGTGTANFAVVQVRDNGASFSLVLRKKLHASSVADGSANTTWYEDMSAGSTAVAAGTAITASGLYKVYLDLCDLILDVTVTSGTLLIELAHAAG